MKRYVGLGPLHATTAEMDYIENLARIMRSIGWHLTTTRYGGVDHAWYDGAQVPENGDDLRMFVKVTDFGDKCLETALKHWSKGWGTFSEHIGITKNVYMLVGPELDEPADALLYPMDRNEGDTPYRKRIEHAVKVCGAYNIPTFNVLTDMEKLEEYMGEMADA